MLPSLSRFRFDRRPMTNEPENFPVLTLNRGAGPVRTWKDRTMMPSVFRRGRDPDWGSDSLRCCYGMFRDPDRTPPSLVSERGPLPACV